jgi:hypothetical protein
MKIRIISPVNKNYLEVFEAFSVELFEYLATKGQLKLLRFERCKKGDLINIQFIKSLKALWVSEIIKDGTTDNQTYFIDEGKFLPYGLENWKHQHIVKNQVPTLVKS